MVKYVKYSDLDDDSYYSGDELYDLDSESDDEIIFEKKIINQKENCFTKSLIWFYNLIIYKKKRI